MYSQSKGNDGKYYYQTPTENSWLDIYYQINNVSHITKLDENKYYGNILTSMTFYYLKEDGTKHIVFELNNDINEAYKPSIDIYNEMIAAYDEYTATYNDDSVLRINPLIKCDIKYNIGAILNMDKDMKVYRVDTNEYGVEYSDTVSLIPKQCTYWYNENIQFPLNYFEIQHEKISTFNKSIDRPVISVNKSQFKCDIKNIIKNDSKSYYFRTDYLFGISSKEKVDGDIYIDRGISYAFAPHLKLGEIKTMESLEQYGNNSFNIENS